MGAPLISLVAFVGLPVSSTWARSQPDCLYHAAFRSPHHPTDDFIWCQRPRFRRNRKLHSPCVTTTALALRVAQGLRRNPIHQHRRHYIRV